MEPKEKTLENPPAFPLKEALTSDNLGMTLRDYFAAKAMQSLIHKYGSQTYHNGRTGIDWESKDGEPFMIAEFSYKMADAMLAERSKA